MEGIDIDQWFSSLYEHSLIQLLLKTKRYKESQFTFWIKVELIWLKRELMSLIPKLLCHSGFLSLCLPRIRNLLFCHLPSLHIFSTNWWRRHSLSLEVSLILTKRTPKDNSSCVLQSAPTHSVLCHHKFPSMAAGREGLSLFGQRDS